MTAKIMLIGYSLSRELNNTNTRLQKITVKAGVFGSVARTLTQGSLGSICTKYTVLNKFTFYEFCLDVYFFMYFTYKSTDRNIVFQ
jgi:hypothetical protein